MAFQQVQWIVNSLALLGLTPLPAIAQIVPDRTLPVNSNVSPNCSNCTITGGTVRGANLFHSFEQFSVPTGGSAYFNNSLNIQNILTRITGQSASTIDGLLQTNGSANLFLINPNGIIFGPNARLNIGGSFLASTATSIKFPDGEFSTNPAQSSPLLSINVPIGLGFGSAPAPIQVLGTGHSLTLQNPLLSPTIGASQSSSGLRVQTGKTIALIGGTVSLDGGILTAPSGQVEVAAVDSGDVGLTAIPQGFALTPGTVSGWKPIQLSNRALLDASGLPGGSIQINGGKVSFTEGATALIQNAGVADAGSIEVNAKEQALFSGVGFQGNSPFPSRLINESVGPGKSGNVIISSPNLTVEAGANISARTYGSGKGGDVILNVPNAIVVRGFSLIFPDLFSHIVAATVGAGDAGNVIATTQTLIGQDGGAIGAAALATGQGGNLSIKAADIRFDGSSPQLQGSGLFSTTTGSGNAGNIVVETARLSITNGAIISASVGASGDAGNVFIQASDFVYLAGVNPYTPVPPRDTSFPFLPKQRPGGPSGLQRPYVSSTIQAAAARQIPFYERVFNLPPSPTGASGSITIETPRLEITDRSYINLSNQGTQSGGTLRISTNTVKISSLGVLEATTFSGFGGDIEIRSNILFLNRGAITASALSDDGSGGNVSIFSKVFAAVNAPNQITANSAGAFGGRILIQAKGVFLSPQTILTASSELGPRFSGVVEIQAPNIDLSRGPLTTPPPIQVPPVVSVCQSQQSANPSQLIISGTGGMPQSPEDEQHNRTGWLEQPEVEPVLSPQTFLPKPSEQPVEAQGWKWNSNGTISLVVQTTNPTTYSSLQEPPCINPLPTVDDKLSTTTSPHDTKDSGSE